MKEDYKFILKKCTILLVEDDNNVRENFKKVLLLYVKDVVEAKDGQEALQIYKNIAPDIMITDIKMPNMSGLELVESIRVFDKNTPIIITSAYRDQDFLLQAIPLGLIAYLIKPIKENDLMNSLQGCMMFIDKESYLDIKLLKNCTYNYINKTLEVKKEIIALTPNEIKFFELLIASKNNLVTKEFINSELFQYKDIPPSALKNLVFKLRKKIKINIIKTVEQLGYQLVCN